MKPNIQVNILSLGLREREREKERETHRKPLESLRLGRPEKKYRDGVGI